MAPTMVGGELCNYCSLPSFSLHIIHRVNRIIGTGKKPYYILVLYYLKL